MVHNKHGFTIVEIMIVVVIVGIIASSLYIGVQPYMMRSRDTKRVSNILQYTNIIEAYEKNFDTFPSNYGSGGNVLAAGYCLSELGRRVNLGTTKDTQFATLNGGITNVPSDSSNIEPIAPCEEIGSYYYSRMKYNGSSEIAIIGTAMEIRESGNYGTGYELRNATNIPDIINAKKGTIPTDSPDQIFIVSKLR